MLAQPQHLGNGTVRAGLSLALTYLVPGILSLASVAKPSQPDGWMDGNL